MAVKKDEALSKPFIQFGATGLRAFSGYVREEFLRELTGWRGIRMYREMRDNDPIIGGMFFGTERLLLGVDFTIEPASAATEDLEAAAFIESCIADLEQSWPELMTEILTFMQYGWSVHEIVYKRRLGDTSNPVTNSKYDDGMIGWRKFSGRAQETLLHWEFDESGDPTALIQLLPTGGPLLRVPLAKCMHFRTRLLKNNPEGVSMLRNAYVPYYRKKNIELIEAIGIERDLCGLPVAKVPPRLLMADASPGDKAQLEFMKALVRDTVRGDQEGIVFPLAYDDAKNEIYKLELLTTGGRRQIDTSQVVDRYDHRITATWLADFITIGTGTSAASGRGSSMQSKNKMDLYKVAVVSILDMIANMFNRKAIPDLLTLNQMAGKCQMRHGEITEKDVLSFAQAVNAVTSVGMLTPSADTEASVRDEIGLPPLLGETKDDLATGGEGGEGSDDDAAGTTSSEPSQAQGQGTTGEASDAPLRAGSLATMSKRVAAMARMPFWKRRWRIPR